MKKLLKKCFVLSFILCLLSISGYGQNELDMADFETMWAGKDYFQIIEKMPDYRDNTLGKRNPIVYYYLGTSYCRLPGEQNKKKGQNSFAAAMSFPDLPFMFQSALRNEWNKCITTEDPMEVSAAEYDRLHGSRGERVSGKTLSTGQFQRIPIMRLRHISREEYQSRLFEIPDTEGAEKKSWEMLEGMFPNKRGNQLGVYSSGHFTIVGIGASAGERKLKTAAFLLERTLEYYQREFSMRQPPFRITVYLPTNGADAERIADHLHGLQIDGRANLGYTSEEDQTIVSQTPGGKAFGTLNHELFHLLAHQFFGDIPAWLDEGVAALYEVSEFDDKGGLSGLDNWRGKKVLGRFWSKRPSVDELIQTDWVELDQAKLREDKEAVTFAMARYFAFYLQEKGKLGTFYAAMQQLTPETMQVDLLTDTRRILLQTMELETMDALDQDFVKWITGSSKIPWRKIASPSEQSGSDRPEAPIFNRMEKPKGKGEGR